MVRQSTPCSTTSGWQTLLDLGGSQSTTIVIRAPIDLIKRFIENFSKRAS